VPVNVTVAVCAGRTGVTLRLSKTQNRSCKRSYSPRCTDDYKGVFHIFCPGNKILLADDVFFFFFYLFRDVQGKDWARNPCLLRQTGEL